MAASDRTFELREHVEEDFEIDVFTGDVVKELCETYGVQERIVREANAGLRQKLTPGAVVGVVRLSDGSIVRFSPKIPISNVFAMWDIAQRSEMNFDWNAHAQVDSVDDMYDKLARRFVERVRRHAVPFWVSMPHLFEQFVAAWLRRNGPDGLAIYEQYPVGIRHAFGPQHTVYKLQADIVLEWSTTGRFVVLDTKYKTPDRADQTDINQVHLYATQLGVSEAWLVYPRPLPEPLDIRLADGVRVRSATFDVSGDLDSGGTGFLQEIGIG